MNTVALSNNVHFYEKVGRGTLVPIEREDITRSVIPADNITYVHKDYAGNADIVVFDDVTGDLYTYGMVRTSTEAGDEGSNGLTYATVTNESGTSSSFLLNNGENLRGVRYGGLVGPARTDGGGWSSSPSA